MTDEEYVCPDAPFSSLSTISATTTGSLSFSNSQPSWGGTEDFPRNWLCGLNPLTKQKAAMSFTLWTCHSQSLYVYIIFSSIKAGNYFRLCIFTAFSSHQEGLGRCSQFRVVFLNAVAPIHLAENRYRTYGRELWPHNLTEAAGLANLPPYTHVCACHEIHNVMKG